MPPQTVLLSLGDSTQESLLNDLYQPLIDQITGKHPNTITIRSTPPNLQTIKHSTNPPPTIFAIDGGIAKLRYKNFHSRLARYVKEDGGTLIFGMLFSSFVRSTDVNAMFAALGVNWKFGNYHRSTFGLSLRANAIRDVFGEHAGNLDREYSMKAVCLKGVPTIAKVYLPGPESRVESAVFPPDLVDAGESPAVFARVGRGKIGFVGDVNNEEGSQRLLLAMLADSPPIDYTSNPSGATAVEEVPQEGEQSPGCVVCSALSPVKRCGRCQSRQYCSVTCQKADWPAHKSDCPKD